VCPGEEEIEQLRQGDHGQWQRCREQMIEQPCFLAAQEPVKPQPRLRRCIADISGMNGRLQIAAARRYEQVTPMAVSATQDRESQVRIRCQMRLERDPDALVRPWHAIVVIQAAAARLMPVSRGDLT
jgi:hypothetical protein